MGAARKRAPREESAAARAADEGATVTRVEHHIGLQQQVETEFAWVPIDSLKVWAQNPRRNDKAVSKVAKSIRRWGFVRPIVANLWAGCEREIIVGHTARLAALSLKLTHVPVRFVAMAPDEAHAAALADNKLGEISAWDQVQLGEIVAGKLLAQPLLEIAGFAPSEIDRLGRPLTANDDEVPDRPKRAVTKPGDVWVLGEHRLVCGDSRDAAVVELCLAGAKPRLMPTDPPYGVNFDPTWRRRVAQKTGICKPPKRTGKVQNDDNASWLAAWELSPAWVAYVWHGALQCDVVKRDLQQAGFEIRSQIIWAKPQINFTRATYHWQHEPCWYGVRKGKQAAWLSDRKQSTLWQIDSKHGVSNPDADDTEHSTQKPVECMARPIRHHGGDVYDPFVGSGTTLIAAEQLGRRCYGIDLDPLWIDVTVERWQRLSGGRPERITRRAA
jgi:DNA modification methylase